jgi:hypothetical protein
MQMETKFLRLRTEVELGSLFDDWQVCWVGGWSKHKTFVRPGDADEGLAALKGSGERNAAERDDSAASGCGRYLEERRYERSPSLLLKDSIGIPLFLPMAPLKKPRTEFGCQPVTFASSFSVTPPGRLSRSRILSVLVAPWGVAVGFFAPAAFGVGSAFSGAALALGLATRALVAGVAVAFLVFFLEVVICGSSFSRQSPRDDIHRSVWSHMQVNS